MQTGRWTIVSKATSRVPRPSQPYMRARVNVRCVCGHQHVVYVEDLERGRTTGCSSRRCKARFEASLDVRHWLTTWALEQLDALEQLARSQLDVEMTRTLTRFAREQYDARISELEQKLAAWLKAPPVELDFDAAEGM